MARGGQAETALCFTSLLFPQPESTQPLKAASPLLQQPTSNRPLGATAQAPASGANNARLRAQVDGVTTQRPGPGAEPGSCQKGFLAPFSRRVFHTSKRLTPKPEFRHARLEGLPRERHSRERLRRRHPLIGSKGFTPYRLLELNQLSQSE